MYYKQFIVHLYCKIIRHNKPKYYAEINNDRHLFVGFIIMSLVKMYCTSIQNPILLNNFCARSVIIIYEFSSH